MVHGSIQKCKTEILTIGANVQLGLRLPYSKKMSFLHIRQERIKMFRSHLSDIKHFYPHNNDITPFKIPQFFDFYHIFNVFL